MQHEKKEQVINLQVTGDLTVAVIHDSNHKFLMPTKDVALGYGIPNSTLLTSKHRHKDELKEGEHFITITKCKGGKMLMWTKAGVIRLGFFIKSERAKLFRDWAEKVILTVTAPKLTLPKPKRRKHNRLTQPRLVRLLGLVSRVEDSNLRKALVDELIPDMEIPSSQLQLSLHSQNPTI